jgi:hypothetical protein
MSTKHEVLARLDFLRMVDLLCTKHCFEWKVSGDFLRHIITGEIDTASSMYIHLFGTGAFVDFMRDLRILKCTEIVNQIDSHAAVYRVHPASDLDNLFLVVIRYNTEPQVYFTAQSMILTKHGLSTPRYPCDVLNGNDGLALLDRMISVSYGDTHRVMNYSDDRIFNSVIMMQERELLMDGYSVCNNPLFVARRNTSNSTCPICLEEFSTEYKRNPYTTLACGHSYCLGCLSKQLLQDGSNYGKCALCRTDIVISVRNLNRVP